MSEAAVAQGMATAARALLERLDAGTLAATQRPFPGDALRRDWQYVPGPREGPAFGDLDRAGRKAVHRLVASGLAVHAYAQVAAIMALEDVLDDAEGGGGDRAREDYHVVVFGEPGTAAPWGWRFEGHHVSLNFTVVDGRVAATPCFLGANPAVVQHDGTAVLRPLVEEEELARALLAALGPAERARAVVADRAPADITTRAAPAVSPLAPLGVAAADLRGDARGLLERLVRLYLDRPAPPLAATRWQWLQRAGPPPVHFAWAGPAERGAGHYYRLTGPDLLVEYDNTQDGANHIHTVWRDPGNDFGGDLLAAHYAAHH